MSVKKRFPLRIRTVFFLALFVLAFLASKPEVRHAVKVWNFSGHAPKAETRFFSIEPSWDQDRLYVLSYRFTYADQLTSASPRIHKKILGSCLKECEIFMGYDGLSKLARNADLVRNICLGNIDMLPNPEILATRCPSTEMEGIYGKKGRCYEFDSNETVRNRYAFSQMRGIGILDDINRRGRESLGKMAPIFCREEAR